MTHQLKVPQAAQSPYPLEQPPHKSAATDRVDTSATREAHAKPNFLKAGIGFGALIGVAAAATVATLLFSNRSGGERQKQTAGMRRKSR